MFYNFKRVGLGVLCVAMASNVFAQDVQRHSNNAANQDASVDGKFTDPVLREFAILSQKDNVIHSEKNGWLIVDDPEEMVVWWFALDKHVAAPSYIKRTLVEKDGKVHVDSKVKCGATKAICDTVVNGSIFYADRQIKAEVASSSELSIEEKSIIYLVLSQTSEVKIHQMRGATGNRVFLHSDGHKEAVYDENGKLVQDGINDGSYNYEHPQKNPFGHFAKDIEPWIRLGNSRGDPTSADERIFAYMGDLEGGIRDARELWPNTSIDALNTAQQQTDFPKSLNQILKRPETKTLFGLVKGEIEYSDENVIRALKALNAAFVDTF